MPPSDWLSWAFWTKDSQGLYHLALIAAGLIGIPLLFWRTRATDRQAKAALEQADTAYRRHDEQTKADRERRITESFAKAGEQLGSDKLETRLVGIYTLERISRESEREYWPIMETLTAFVREHAPWPPRQALGNPFVQLQLGSSGGDERKEAPQPKRAPIRPATDIQAVLTVLGRRDEKACKLDQAAERRVDLKEIDLRGVNLGEWRLGQSTGEIRGAHLEGALLAGAHLEGALLAGVHLEGADLIYAHLEGAELSGAHLEDANFFGARLEGARLVGAHLEGAILSHVHLEDADLFGAQLEGALLVGANLEDARLDNAHLEDANLEDANLHNARLRDANLTGASLTQEQVDEAWGNEKTTLPDGLTRPAYWLAAPADRPPEPDNAE